AARSNTARAHPRGPGRGARPGERRDPVGGDVETDPSWGDELRGGHQTLWKEFPISRRFLGGRQRENGPKEPKSAPYSSPERLSKPLVTVRGRHGNWTV